MGAAHRVSDAVGALYSAGAALEDLGPRGPLLMWLATGQSVVYSCVVTASIPSRWIPMIREASIAAESLYSGLNSLAKANFTQESLYLHAFFGITIGLERMAKLAILVETRTRADGRYPTDEELRKKYGHDLIRLFARVEEIRAEHEEDLEWDLPDRAIAEKALSILAGFAKSTRYYNMKMIIGDKGVESQHDPIAAWMAEIGSWALENKYRAHRAQQDREYADLVELMIGSRSMVAHIAEDGAPIVSVRDMALRSRQFPIVQREGTKICVYLARHVSELLWVLATKAQNARADDIPDLGDFFRILHNDDSYFRRRKTFSII